MGRGNNMPTYRLDLLNNVQIDIDDDAPDVASFLKAALKNGFVLARMGEQGIPTSAIVRVRLTSSKSMQKKKPVTSEGVATYDSHKGQLMRRPV
jgi:hypothetical protein